EEFTDEDEAILSALSTQAAVAIDNTRLFLSLIQKNKQLVDTTEQLERRLRDLELLFELEQAMAHATSIETLVGAVMQKAAAACEARGAALLTAEEESGDLVLYLYDATEPSGLRRLGVKAGEGFLGGAMLKNELILAAAVDSDPRFSRRLEGSFSFPVVS